MSDKEQVYDGEISPLMTKIIAICKEHEIPVLASFSIPTEEHPDMACTTSISGDDDSQWPMPDCYAESVQRIRYPRGAPFSMTVRDGDGEVVEKTVVFP